MRSDPSERPAAKDDSDEARQKGNDLEYDAQDQSALGQDDTAPTDDGETKA